MKNFFGPKYFFGSKKMFDQKKIVPETNSEFKKMFLGRQILGLKKVFEKFLCPTNFWVKSVIWTNVATT